MASKVSAYIFELLYDLITSIPQPPTARLDGPRLVRIAVVLAPFNFGC
jgi:hypothetical protein